MNSAQLLAHFDRISHAPDAIPRLRRFILDLAVRGKLVEQDSRDEPAVELLKRIQTEKAQPFFEGRTRKSKDALAQSDIPFNAPSDWEWVPFGEIVRIRTGKLDANAAVEGGRYPFFTCSQTPSEIDSYSFDTSAVLLAGNGDFNLKYYQGKFDAYQRTYVIEPLGWDLQFCFILMKSQISRITENQRGSAIPYLKLADIADPLVPLPPLAEQHRIVAKVDELMALCDRLEAAQAGQESRRDRLVASSLNRLNNGVDAEAFQDHTRFYFNHLPRLTTKPEHIQQLRRTILSLATRGKLVPQNPGEDPASAAVNFVSQEAQKAICDGIIRRHGPTGPADGSELPGLPLGWRWTRLVEIARPVPHSIKRGPFGSAIRKDMFVAEGFKVYEQQHAISGDFTKGHYYIKKSKFEELRGFELHPGELLVSCSGTVGKVAIVPSTIERGIINQALLKLSLHQAAIVNEYFLILFPAFFMETEALTNLQGTAQKNIPGVAVLKEMLFPLPPLAEQHRIVAKVEELMALCDKLDAQLATTHTDSRRLLESVLHEALAGTAA